MKKEDLELVEPHYNDEVEIHIKGDVNDGDDVEKLSRVSLEEFEAVLPILKKLASNNEYENITSEEQEILEEDYCLIPYGEMSSIHRIEFVRAWFLSEDDNKRYEIRIIK